jgi:hypothetical protein
MVGIPTVVACFRLLEPESLFKAKYWVAKTKKNIAVLSTDRQTRKHNILDSSGIVGRTKPLGMTPSLRTGNYQA